MRWAWALLLFGVLTPFACGKRSGPDPFAGPNSADGGAAGMPDTGEAGADAGGEDPTLGGPCLDEGQCDDGVDCTVDRCDLELGRCRHLENDARCADDVFCNGIEVCDRLLGCRSGGVRSCSDENTCTIDRCVEETQSCEHEPRDADGDGDPERACGGGDCRDDEPLVSSEALERCGNRVDDDCDGSVDEADCVEPNHDRCGDALTIENDGVHELSLAGAGGDYALSCSEGARVLRDVVVAVVVPEGGPVDVDLVATVPTGDVFLAASERCGELATEVACAAGVELDDGGAVSRLLVRAAKPGPLAVIVAASAETDVLLKVVFRDGEPAPSHETCGTARELEPGVVERVTLAGLNADLESACPVETGELVYSFDLAEPSDVRLRAVALDDFGEPVISLRSGACRELDDELTCRAASPTELFARALPPGRHYVALAGTGPSDVELVLEIEAATDPPADEDCVDPPRIEPGETAQISLADHVDDVRIGCLVGAPDAVRRFELSARSDVYLLLSGSQGDRGAVLAAEAPCLDDAERLACALSDAWPVRTVARGVGPGSLRAVAETAGGAPAALPFSAPPAPPTVLVHRSDDCSDAFEIPETGGRFEGNTQNAFADHTASCDYGGQTSGGAPDQTLAFTLTTRRRMIFDLEGSEYDTLLVLRHAEGCPGPEVFRTCIVGTNRSRSFLDVELEPGSYFLQIDGYNGASGAWTLEVFSAER